MENVIVSSASTDDAMQDRIRRQIRESHVSKSFNKKAVRGSMTFVERFFWWAFPREKIPVSAVTHVKDGAIYVGKKARDGAFSVGKKTRDGALYLGEKTKDVAKSAADKTKEGAGNLADKIKEKIRQRERNDPPEFVVHTL